MSDYIDVYEFARISTQPHRVGRKFAIRAHSGVDGVGLWDLGLSGEPFTVRALAFFANMILAKAWYATIKDLEGSNPMTVTFADVEEPNHLYQVLNVQPVPGGIRPVVLGRGPGGFYYARCELEITLLPIWDA